MLYYDSEHTEFYPFKPYSEKLAEKVDQKVKELVTEAYAKAVGLIKKYKDQIALMSGYLLEREYITKEEFNLLMEDPEHMEVTLASFKKKTAQLIKDDKKMNEKEKTKKPTKRKKDEKTIIKETLDTFLGG